MKKIFYFIASAIVALGAVACQNDINENIAPESEGLSFTAEVEMTRITIGEKDDTGYPVVWENGDGLDVAYENENGETITFTFTFNGEEFVCKEENVNNLVDKNVRVNYYASSYGIDSKAGKAGMCLATSEEVTFENDMTIKLSVQNSFLRFSSTDDVTLTLSEGAYFADNEGEFQSITLKGNDVWVAFAYGMDGGTYTLSASIDGVPFKEKTDFAPEYGKIYNLGEIEKEEVVVPAEKLYLVPNKNWKADNAWFAAYFWNATTNVNKSIVMTDADADGIYECEVPADMDKVIFCRMNPEYPEFAWDVIEGEGESFKVLEDRVWNQTADLEIGVAPDNYYYINGWESGLWGDKNTDPTVSVAGQNSEWALVGAFNDWKDQYFITTETAGIVVLEDVTMKAAEGFLVRKPSTDWADKYGASDVNYLKANHFITTSKDGADMCLEADGTYDIYFDASTKNIYIMTAGTDYNTATEQTVNGEEPKQEEPEVTENVIYLKPNSNWTQSNARFAAYFWNDSGNVWVSMVDSDKDGIYEVNLPEGYDYGCNVIFCRMNPATTANNWNNKWNQTSDLTVPTDGKNLYTVKAGTWSEGGGTWSVK